MSPSSEALLDLLHALQHILEEEVDQFEEQAGIVVAAEFLSD